MPCSWFEARARLERLMQLAAPGLDELPYAVVAVGRAAPAGIVDRDGPAERVPVGAPRRELTHDPRARGPLCRHLLLEQTIERVA